MPDDTIGRYQILRPLGRGGQGRVVAALQDGPGPSRTVALKLLEGATADLFREARLTSLLRHPHLVDVYEVGEAEGVAFCAMELCDRALAGCGPLGSRAVVEVGLQVCAALAYAHDAMELVHQDLKPANLLVRGGVVKVADLGIASARGFARLRAGGTPRFMAPEQRVGAAVDVRTDVFGLGQVLAELATGGAATDAETLAEAVEEPRTAGVAPWLREIWERCTEPDPMDRFASMQDLADALRQVACEGPGLAEALGFDVPVAIAHGQSMVGRGRLVASLHASLRDPGLYTLKGPAGVGKTRLARTIWEGWRYERWFVDLAAVSEVSGMLQRVAAALEVRLPARSDAVGQLGRALQSRERPLLVLDNVEQLTGSLAVVSRWLEGAPLLRVLLTSRSATGLAGEEVVEVPTLGMPESVALLRARAAERGVHTLPDAGLQELAQRLEGLPLALELAAGRLGVLSVADVLVRLELSLLRSGELGLAPRQATLRGALDWSWQLLEPVERSALGQLSVFRGGFERDAAAAIVDLDGDRVTPVLDVLSRHSLVQGEGRGSLSTTVREYAALRLSESGDREGASLRHARWYGRLTVRHDVERELGNVRMAAVVARRASDWESAVGAAVAAAGVFADRGPVQDGIALLDTVLDGCPQAYRAPLLLHRAELRIRTAVLDGAERDLREAAELGAAVERVRGELLFERGDRAGAERTWLTGLARSEAESLPVGRDLLWLGTVALREHRLDEARSYFERARAALAEEGDVAGEAAALGRLGIIARRDGDAVLAESRFQEALVLEQGRGNRLGLADHWTSIAVLRVAAGQPEQAYVLFQKAARAVRDGGFRAREATQLGYLAEMALHLGALEDARKHAEGALHIHEESKNPSLVGFAAMTLGRIAAGAGRSEEAERWLRRAEALGDPFSVMVLAELALEGSRLEEAETWIEAALERLTSGGDAHWRAESIRAEVLAERARRAGVPIDRVAISQKLEGAVAALLPVSPAMAVEALCSAARALDDAAFLVRAQAVAERSALYEGSPTLQILERTRLRLAGR